MNERKSHDQQLHELRHAVVLIADAMGAALPATREFISAIDALVDTEETATTPPAVVELAPSDWYHLTGRGQMAAVDLRQLPNCPELIEHDSQLPIGLGQHVFITGHGQYQIQGIECARLLTYPPTIKPTVGLLLKASTPEAADAS